jgi:hypothetical protein
MLDSGKSAEKTYNQTAKSHQKNAKSGQETHSPHQLWYMLYVGSIGDSAKLQIFGEHRDGRLFFQSYLLQDLQIS